MTRPIVLLTEQERQRLTQPERVEVGRYRTWVPVRPCEFVVSLDAQPLAALIDETSRGRRLYELMAIRRPGELLHYLRIGFQDLDHELLAKLRSMLAEHWALDACPALPFLEFDACFPYDWDDTPPEAAEWRYHRSGEFWKTRCAELLTFVRTVQCRLRECDDYLTRHELALMDAERHARDFMPDIERALRTGQEQASDALSIPEALYAAIVEMIGRDNVRSVSCPFPDYRLWRRLVEEQVRRAQATGQALQRAFGLFGPEGGLPHIPIADWGGEVHIPYEGTCGADLFVVPGWHKFDPERARAQGTKLSATVARACHHLLVRKDAGELPCATRTVIGEWTLYTSTAPYRDCNPFFEQHLKVSSDDQSPD